MKKRVQNKDSFINKNITVNRENGIIEFKGKFFSTNESFICCDFLDSLIEKTVTPNSTTSINIKLTSINIKSSKLIYYFLKQLEKKQKSCSNIEVNWFYEVHNSDIEEAGEDFQEVTGIPFRLVAA